MCTNSTRASSVSVLTHISNVHGTQTHTRTRGEGGAVINHRLSTVNDDISIRSSQPCRLILKQC